MSSESLIPISKILPEEVEKVSAALKAAGDRKCLDPIIFDVTGHETFTDYIMVCHGTSDRHVQAVYEGIEAQLRTLGHRAIGVEGESLCHWVLMDFGGLVVHIFYEPLREFYDIEGLWADCPRLDLDALDAAGIVQGQPKDDEPAEPTP